MSGITNHDIIAQFREEELHNRQLGDRFERLICRYLELDPIFADEFSNVYMWNEWPKKGNTGDIGIDIVAEERATGEFCAIQCKFYLPEHTLSKDDIDSFLNALGDKRFTSGIIISTTDRWGSNAEKSLANRDKPVRRLRVQDLDDSPIDWSRFSLKDPRALGLRAKKNLRPHQTAAKADVISGLAGADRGKLIMACGTGKTFTSLRIAEEMAPAGHVLFLVPSLSLLSQSLREWTAEAENPIHALAVCSDVNVGKRSNRDAPGDDDTAGFRVRSIRTRLDIRAFGLPDDGSRVLVMGLDVFEYRAIKFLHAPECAAPHTFLRQLPEEPLHHVQPRRARRRVPPSPGAMNCATSTSNSKPTSATNFPISSVAKRWQSR